MGVDTFRSNLDKVGIAIDDNRIDMFNKYYNILVEWNEFMNLTGITDYEEVLLKHYVDSVAINAVDEIKDMLKKDIKVLDIGTGAGFPGLPLKIIYDNLNITLLDSLNKRIKFLNEVIQQLNLSKISAVHARAEDYAKDKNYRESFDICVSRAVANLATLSEYCIPYVKVGGYFIAYKSGEIDEEVNASKHAISVLGGKIIRVHKLILPNSDIERSFVIIQKVKNTAGKYPRKAGLPTKEPIA